MDRTPAHIAVLAIFDDATTGDLSSENVAHARATQAGPTAGPERPRHESVWVSLPSCVAT